MIPPQWAVGASVVDPSALIWALHFEHAEAAKAAKAAKLLSQIPLQDHLARRLGLVEAWLVLSHYPQGQHQSARSPEEELAHFTRIHRRVLNSRSLVGG
jgi:hypothetical protein